MAWTKVTRTQITGLTISGTADTTGVWNASIDMGSFVTVPTGATGVIIYIHNTFPSGPRWAGVGTTGSVNRWYLSDQPANSLASRIFPMGPGNTLDLYLETTSIQFWIVGFTGPETVLFDRDLPPPTFNEVGTTWTTQDFSASIPSGAVAAIVQTSAATRNFRPVGETQPSGAGTYSSAGIVPLTAGREFQVYGDGVFDRVIGYMTSGVTTAWNTDVGEDTADGTYRTAPISNSDASFAIVMARVGGGNDSWFAREAGETLDPGMAGVGYGSVIVPLNASGQFEVAAETGITVDLKIDAWILTETATGPTHPFTSVTIS